MHSALVIAQKFCNLAKEKEGREGVPYSITYLKLMKLLYIAHGHKLALKDAPLFSDTIEAWKYGPVVPSVYYLLKQIQPNEYMVPGIPSVRSEDVDSLLDDDVEMIKGAFDHYYKYSADQLVSITHDKQSPWYKLYHGWFTGENPVIPDDETKRYYVALLAKKHEDIALHCLNKQTR